MPYHPIILPLSTKVVVCLLYNGFYSLIDLQLLLHLSIKFIMWRHISYKVAWDVIQLAEEFFGHLEFFQNYPRIKIVFRLFSNSLCVVWFLFYVLAMKKPHQTFLLINWIYLHLPSWFLFCVFLSFEPSIIFIIMKMLPNIHHSPTHVLIAITVMNRNNNNNIKGWTFLYIWKNVLYQS